MAYEKFGMARHKPTGQWVQTTALLTVAGSNHRRADVERFFNAVRAAETRSLLYGVRLILEPENRHDPNAIAVYGFAEGKGWFGKSKVRSWHVGYLPAEDAADVQSNILGRGLPIEAELYSLYANNDYREIRIFVLAPPGNSESARRRR
jgi:hypothetical protein